MERRRGAGRVEAPEIEFVIPREGSAIWMDTLAIPANAPNVPEALQFIDYILRPDVAARIAEFTHYGTANAAATALLTNPVPYPTPAEMARLEFYRDLGQAIEPVDRIWTEVRPHEADAECRSSGA